MTKSCSLGEICDVIMGQAPSGDAYNTDGNGWPLIAGAGDFRDSKPDPKKFTTEASKLSKAGDVVLGIRASIGEKVVADREYCLGRGVAALRTHSSLDRRFLWHWLTYFVPRLAAKGKGATFKQVNRDDITSMPILLRAISEQRQIAAVLDQAEALRAKRREAHTQLDQLARSVFLDMFGDPASNVRGWHHKTIGSLAVKYSDGPFGSNLKSSHYVQRGIRVIRLQNIGPGEFLDQDVAYIAEDHFAGLRRHECLPGDILIGTLGEPNLRACIQPGNIPIALNKADCVQFRPNYQLVTGRYICALLNQPSIERMAQGIALGQTRLRISMGRLRNLKVPVPPLELQREFEHRVDEIDRLKAIQRAHLAELDALFQSLQHRAFRGEL